MAHLPFMNAATCETAYFGGIENIMWALVRHEMPCSKLGLLLGRKPMKGLAQMPAKLFV
jgi:hypothetical protein